MFSVVIPLFNKEATIAATLSSVLSQSFKDFEVIIVDDGSTDGSAAVVSTFKDPRLRVYAHANRGVAHARNYAISKAQQKYIAFLDADDTWQPNYLEEMARLIHTYTDCAIFNAAYKVIGPNRVSVHCNTLSEGVIEDFFKTRLSHHIMRTSAIVVDKKVFDSVGGFPEGMIGGEDDYTWTKMALQFKIAFTPKVLAAYNGRNSSYNVRRGQQDTCKESWFDFYEEGSFYRNEFIASKAITAGIRYAYGAPQEKSWEIERRTKDTVLSKKQWKNLYYLNRLPYVAIVLLRTAIPIYKRSRFWLARRKTLLLKKLFLSEETVAD